ncbi:MULTISPECIES: LysM peptidoglycan-binding domain-containing protein [Actinosynnema]|uniref:LysM peptidoglycan-binding domain-containing protein n=1 Tax=Actinosynnema TaxID=40566 RepID=UPI0020A369B5|nr:LysM peptidoglycan-binding domain-containing protein [Actinosynnema pretiosum]MCP2093210.1 hypothetical protein [Actinosynnema pretiosum]
MAVVLGTSRGFALVEDTRAEEVPLGAGTGTGAVPGPRVLRRFESSDGLARRRPVSARSAPLPAPEATPAPSRARSPLRAFGGALLAALAAAAVSLAYLHASGISGVPDRTTTAHVQVGETLRDVAERSAPGSDPEAVAERISELNGLGGPDAVVRPGQALVVPDGLPAP